MNKKCPFCGVHPATQKNSHIFTKSLSKTLRNYKGKNKLYKIDRYGKIISKRPVQDTPKEDYLVCPICEKDEFGNLIERPVINSFYNQINNIDKFINVIYKRKYLYRAYYKVDYKLIKIFIYLQLYRAHLSGLEYFEDINLSSSQLGIIKDSLSGQFTDLDILILTCDTNDEDVINVQLATFINQENYLLWINDFIYIISFSKYNRTKFLCQFEEAICNNGTIRIVLQSKSQWERIRGNIFSS